MIKMVQSICECIHIQEIRCADDPQSELISVAITLTRISCLYLLSAENVTVVYNDMRKHKLIPESAVLTLNTMQQVLEAAQTAGTAPDFTALRKHLMKTQERIDLVE